MSALTELSEALGLRVAGVRRVRLHIDGNRQDHPNAFELLLPDWAGWTHP